MGLNTVSIMGNLTRDPEIKYVPSGKAVCELSMANNHVYSKNGEKVDEVSYFDIDVWGVAAENCAKYLAKGNGIIVEGRLRQDRWEKDGKTQSRVKITANAVHFLPKRQNHAAQQAAADDKPAEVETAAVTENSDWEG
ncbi:MAG: single-stranded DNA-binding protein [Candidatus Omnitrophica bacterium]|nr:single-stranded DNA-binding protein [Candidatus Omnitrophota bacterium]MDE2010437.1 single-stranded DNA-binding protein [Candidatus Omnitrophota bacterium]MDE2215354.1 single-stranded DNA-binding protein [Candidatus Omnitrophota bacterium]MDE2232309.1 single-stranded DNA-binding protein [Candidatus Omnitrophota bacterium]